MSTSTLIEDSIPIKRTRSEVVVQKVVKDYKSIRKVIDKKMVKNFSKMFFLKPKPDEIECESIDLVYEAFMIMNIKYHIEYYRNKNYALDVDDNVVESIIFNQSLKPVKRDQKSGGHKQIAIESKEFVVDEKVKQVAIDRKGKLINYKNLPSSQSEPDPIKFLDSYRTNVRHIEVSIPELLRKSIEREQENIAQIVNEHIEITNQVLIYTPIFEARCKNFKTREIKIIPVSAITGKIFGF